MDLPDSCDGDRPNRIPEIIVIKIDANCEKHFDLAGTLVKQINVLTGETPAIRG